MVKYWTSTKQKSVVSERRKQLDLLFQFANADLAVQKSYQVKNQTYSFLESMMRGQPAIYSLTLSAGKGDLMQKLQKHLRVRLKSLADYAIGLAEMSLWTVSGSLEFTVDPIRNRFHERFRFRKIKAGNELKALKRMVDLALIEIIRDMDFKPKRFRQCPRCGNIYYQPTKKEKAYCSIRCGDAVRLQEFRRERRKAQGEKPE